MKASKKIGVVLIALGCAGAISLLFASSAETADPAESLITQKAPTRFAAVIREAPGTPKVLTDRTNHLGQPVSASCSSCHSTTTPNREIQNSDQLLKFHQGMHFDHGSQSCLNCHNENNYDTLRFANGKSVEYADVMNLCGQCHGPQLRDYQRGLHGGMNGHWDLNRGPRTRNNCIHCHDPHAPAFPMVQPVLPPKDRITGETH